jgi:hypothetical protein
VRRRTRCWKCRRLRRQQQGDNFVSRKPRRICRRSRVRIQPRRTGRPPSQGERSARRRSYLERKSDDGQTGPRSSRSRSYKLHLRQRLERKSRSDFRWRSSVCRKARSRTARTRDRSLRLSSALGETIGPNAGDELSAIQLSDAGGTGCDLVFLLVQTLECGTA